MGVWVYTENIDVTLRKRPTVLIPFCGVVNIIYIFRRINHENITITEPAIAG